MGAARVTHENKLGELAERFLHANLLDANGVLIDLDSDFSKHKTPSNRSLLNLTLQAAICVANSHMTLGTLQHAK